MPAPLVATLAVRSVRRRPGRFAATLLSAFLGATVVMTFGSLFDTAAAPGIDAVSAESMTIAASVVGGYGSLLVFFAIASTLTVNVRQRGPEIRLLRCSGATPGQIARMVVGEAALVGLLGALLAVGPAMLGGRVLLALFQDSGQVAGNVAYVFGPTALSIGSAVTLSACAGAAFLAVRRASRAAATRHASRGRGRAWAGVGALAAGAVSLASTFVVDGDAEFLMAFPAYGAILISVGFAVLAPALLGRLLGVVRGPLDELAGAGGHLTVRNLRGRASELAGILMPMILFTGMATATLAIQAVETDRVTAGAVAKSVGDKNVETLNLVVVGVIVVFSCIMLINSLYAATSYRRREFGQQRLAGATPGQVLAVVGGEALVLAFTGLFLGTVASLAGIVAFTVVRTDQVLPGQLWGIWLPVAAVAVSATLVTALGTARHALRTPAIEAVAAV